MPNLRNLGIAVFTVLALLVVPSMASASGGLVADQYGTVLRGEESSSYFTAKLGLTFSAQCHTGILRGEIKGPSAKYGLSSAQGGLEEGSCSSTVGGGPIDMNSCQLEFEPGTQTAAVGPPGCGGIDMTVGYCAINVVPQSGLPATQENSAEGDVSISLNASGVKNYTAKKVGGCPDVGYHENLTLSSLNLDVEGYRSDGGWEGPAVDISVIASGALPVGVFTTEGDFDAQAFPVQYHAAPVSAGKLKLLGIGTRNVTCETATAAKTEAPAGALKFTEFGGCISAGSVATVNANSCSYEFDGDAQVSCTKEGDVIEIATNVCTITVPPQTLPGSGYTAEDQGEGYDATIHVNSASETGVKYSNKKDKAGCVLIKSNASDGNFTADVNLSGTYAG